MQPIFSDPAPIQVCIASVSTVEAFKRVVLAARTVSASSTSGIWLARDLFPRLGILEKLDAKIAPRGTGAAAMVADGSVDVAVMPISEILAAKGVDYAGSLAPEIQFPQVFSAAGIALPVGPNDRKNRAPSGASASSRFCCKSHLEAVAESDSVTLT